MGIIKMDDEFVFDKVDILEQLKLFFQNDVEDEILQNTSSDNEYIQHEAVPKKEKEDLFSMFKDKIEGKNISTRQQKSLEQELHEYMKMTVDQDFDDPFIFWRDSKLVKLKFAARRIFAVPASSAEPERHNSAAGNTLTSLRASMSDRTVSMLVFLNEFLKN